jgi:leader peptidase (prepilin peptidase)/N-methyltransferase
VSIVLLRAAIALLGGALTGWGLSTGSAGSRPGRILLHGCAAAALSLLLLPALDGFPGTEWAQAVLLSCLLYGLAVADLRSLSVPLPVVFGGIAIRIASLALLEREALLPMMLGLFAGAGMLALTGLAYELVRHRPGLGAGDTAVLGLIGCFVGWQGLVPALLGAALAGLIGGGGGLMLLRKPLHTPLPFAPFLAAGGWAVFAAQHAGWLPGVP